MTSIDVSDTWISQETALELLAAMKGKEMTSISMASCKLGVEGAKMVVELLSSSKSLTQVVAFVIHVLVYSG